MPFFSNALGRSIPRLQNLARTFSSSSSHPLSRRLLPALVKTPNSFSDKIMNAHVCAAMSELAYKPLENHEESIKEILNVDSDSAEFQYFANKKTSTQAFGIANQSAVLIVFRGTQYDLERDPYGFIRDWSINFDLKLTNLSTNKPHIMVHNGFYDSLNSIWQGSKPSQNLQQFVENHAGKTLFLTGHSLGSALATTAGAKLIADDIVSMSDIGGIYTFGSPKCGDATFHEFCQQTGLANTIVRMVNNNDIVAVAPFTHDSQKLTSHFLTHLFQNVSNLLVYLSTIPNSNGYRHVGELFYINRHGKIETRSTPRSRKTDAFIGGLRGGALDPVFDHRHKLYFLACKEANLRANSEAEEFIESIPDVTDRFMQPVFDILDGL